MKTLADIKINDVSTVKDLNFPQNKKRRLIDLGIIPGTKIQPIFKSPSGNLTAYSFKKSVIAIRYEDAENIIMS